MSAEPSATGRPADHPATLLKVYIYGYLNRVQSSRRLEREATQHERLTVLADRGYFNGQEILQCEQAGSAPLVPKPLTSNSKADGRFDRRDLIYITKHDEYRCPAGKRAIWRMTTQERALALHRYWSSDCPRCPIRNQCTPADSRRITRWEFGTIKAWKGSTHFLTKTLPRVQAEMSLHVLAYNMKRAINILGAQTLMRAMRA